MAFNLSYAQAGALNLILISIEYESNSGVSSIRNNLGGQWASGLRMTNADISSSELTVLGFDPGG